MIVKSEREKKKGTKIPNSSDGAWSFAEPTINWSSRSILIIIYLQIKVLEHLTCTDTGATVDVDVDAFLHSLLDSSCYSM